MYWRLQAVFRYPYFLSSILKPIGPTRCIGMAVAAHVRAMLPVFCGMTARKPALCQVRPLCIDLFPIERSHAPKSSIAFKFEFHRAMQCSHQGEPILRASLSSASYACMLPGSESFKFQNSSVWEHQLDLRGKSILKTYNWFPLSPCSPVLVLSFWLRILKYFSL